MAVLLLVIDENYRTIKKLGTISAEDIQEISKNALKMNLPCLSFVDYVGDTIFNEKQLLNIKKEIRLLKSNLVINGSVWSLLEEGIDFALSEPFYYLCFQGD